MPRVRKPRARTCHLAMCATPTDRRITVSGVAHDWWTCGRHGRKTVKALMGLYPGRAIKSHGRTIITTIVPEGNGS